MTVTVTSPPLLYLTALDSRQRMFSVNQCLSVIMLRLIDGGNGRTLIAEEDFKCLWRKL